MKSEDEAAHGAGHAVECGAQLSVERRKEARYPVAAPAIVRRENGESLPATAIDISASGLRLEWPEPPCPLAYGEHVAVDVQLPESPDKPFSAWGFGRVAFIESRGAGIQLFGGHFDPPPEAASADRTQGGNEGKE